MSVGAAMAIYFGCWSLVERRAPTGGHSLLQVACVHHPASEGADGDLVPISSGPVI